MQLVKPQGNYIVWGYWLPHGTAGGFREHICTFAELDRCIASATEYHKKKRFAQVQASTGTIVFDSRFPEQRQAERVEA